MYAVGDIHGRLDLLQKMLGLIITDVKNHQAKNPQLIFLGDYVDRGLESKQVIDLLLGGLPTGFTPIFLKGNHEDALLKFLGGDLETGLQWLTFGGRETLFSYQTPVALIPENLQAMEQVRSTFAAKLPPAHKYFLEQLVLRHEVGDYCFVHAGIKPGVPLASQSPQDLMWIRDEFLRSKANHGKIIVHGHTISDEPEVLPNRIGIDTGAFATTRLTCLVLHGETRRFLVT